MRSRSGIYEKAPLERFLDHPRPNNGFSLRFGAGLLGFLLTISAPKLAAQSVKVYLTTPDLSQNVLEQEPLSFAGHGAGSGRLSIAINESETYQQIGGIGVSITCQAPEGSQCPGPTAPSGNDLQEETEKLLITPLHNGAKNIWLWTKPAEDEEANNNPLAEVCGTCRSFVTTDDDTSPSTAQVDIAALRHAGNFVASGAYRIEATNFVSGSVEDVAFRNPDGTMVLVALNSGTNSVTINVLWSQRVFTYGLPAGALATFVWDPSAALIALSASPSNLSLKAGESASIQLGVQPLTEGGLQVALSCTGEPPESTCTAMPSSVHFGDSTPANATLTLTTTAPSPTNGRVTGPRGDGRIFAVAAAFGAFFLTGLACFSTKPKLPSRQAVFAVLVLGGVLAGCAENMDKRAAAIPRQGTTPGSYTLTITATPDFGSPAILNVPVKVN